MKLRNKVLASLLLVWIGFLVVTYFVSHFFILDSFLKLETAKAQDDLYRLNHSLNQANHSLYTFTSDWAHWNDSYNFILNKNPNFVANNIVLNAFLISNVNMYTLWNKQGKLLLGLATDMEKKQFVNFPSGIKRYFANNTILLAGKNFSKIMIGYVLLDDGLAVIVKTPVTNNNGTAPIIGNCITLRKLTPAFMDKLQATLRLDVNLLLPSVINKDPDLVQIMQTAMVGQADQLVKAINESTLTSYLVIRDINNRPVAMFKVNVARSIYQQGKRTMRYYFLSFVLLALLVSALLWRLLDKLILKRLEALDHSLAEISHKKELAKRVEVQGKDEIASLAMQVNGLLDVNQVYNEALEKRVNERTQALQETNLKLHTEIKERQIVEVELRKHKEYLAHLAHYDPLTELPNRVLFNDILSKAIVMANTKHEKLAVLFIDADRFKNINDAYGHSIGDKILKEVAKRFATLMPENATLARMGGDEFIVLLKNTTQHLIKQFADDLLASLTTPIQIAGYTLYLTVSIGISVYPDDGVSLEELQKNADAAMYKAKRSGGSTYNFFDQAMSKEALQNIKLETELRHAIDNQELILYFQPKVYLKTGKLAGVEALIRWEHPEYGLIQPGKFIPLAEETGLILPIGEYILFEACRINKKWQTLGHPPLSVAVNISAKQFRFQDIPTMVANALLQADLAAEYLELEITESAVMDNVQEVTQKLQRLRDMGVKISVDDFGTGYTSMNYLKQFPVNLLKVDQSFIRGIPQNLDDVSITKAVITLGHSLGMQVIAEGVETQEQVQWLADHDCDIIQGYFVSRPIPEDEVFEQMTGIHM